MGKFAILLPLSLAWTTPAMAVCGSAPCNITAQLDGVTPSSDCVTVRVYGDGCDCAVVTELTNHCGGAVLPKEGALIDCSQVGSEATTLENLAPGATRCHANYAVQAGPLTDTFVFTDGAGEHRVTASAEVEEFYDGACSVRHSGRNRWAQIGLIATLFAIGIARRRFLNPLWFGSRGDSTARRRRRGTRRHGMVA